MHSNHSYSARAGLAPTASVPMQVRVRFLMAFATICILLAPGFVQPLLAKKKVRVDYDKAADFSRFKTYAWVQGTPAMDPRMDTYIKNSITDVLKQNGMTEAEVGKADMIATYHVASQGDMSVGTALDPTYAATGGVPLPGQSIWQNSGTGSTYVRKGTIEVLLLDRAANKAVWTGVAQDSVSETLGGRWEQVQRALSEMFSSYPPTSKPK